MNKKRGFTLIELLVVIAIIALLMSILMPALSKVKKQATAVVCRSRMKQWGVVFSMYTNENDGFFHSREIGTVPGYSKMWPYVYKTKYNDPKMRFCPSAENPQRDTGPFGTWNYTVGSYYPLSDPILRMPGEREYEKRSGTVVDGFFTGSLGMNRLIENMKGGPATVADPAFWRKADWKGGDRVPVLMDAQYLYYNPGSKTEPPEYNGAYTGGEMKWICIDRHMGYNNIVYLDFSARKTPLKELWSLKHTRTFDTCDMWTICGNGGGNAGKSTTKGLWDIAAPWMSSMPVY